MSFQLFSRQSLLLVISFFMCLPLCSCGGIKVDDLKCEYLKNPLAIDNTQPHFSWKMTSRNNGAHSTAYHILVATEIDKLNENQADLWNSGKVEVRWETSGNDFMLAVKIPVGSTATVFMPDGSEHTLCSGKHKLSCSRL